MVVPEHTVHYLEIVTNDVQAARDLYPKAYGRRFEAMEPELGNSFVAPLLDGSLCGIRAPMHEQEKPIVRTYLRVGDTDGAVRRAPVTTMPPLIAPTTTRRRVGLGKAVESSVLHGTVELQVGLLTRMLKGTLIFLLLIGLIGCTKKSTMNPIRQMTDSLIIDTPQFSITVPGI